MTIRGSFYSLEMTIRGQYYSLEMTSSGQYYSLERTIPLTPRHIERSASEEISTRIIE